MFWCKLHIHCSPHHQWCSTSLWPTSARAPCSTSSCGRVSSSARASRCVSTVRSGTPRRAALAQGYVLNLHQGFDDSRITENNPNSTAKPREKNQAKLICAPLEYYAINARGLWRHSTLFHHPGFVLRVLLRSLTSTCQQLWQNLL